MQQIVVGTAGHIDHGKTTLVRGLTGYNTDHLVEEKKRGMTIDLGFAYLNDSVTIIDVPGHEKFIRNMAAGAANIHFGLIVIAADDGIMPQTIEHLEILTLLGVKSGWVAITKIDIVKDEEWIDLVELDIQDCLSLRGFNAFSIHRINNLNGNGLNKLKSDIKNIVNKKVPYSNSEYFRLFIDRVFIKTGFGTVVTGTVVNGRIEQGEEIEILPLKAKTKIRGIQSHGGGTEAIQTGDRAALNISNIKLSDLQRGQTLCYPGLLKPTKNVIVRIKMIQSTSWEIKNNQRLRFHFGTSEVIGRIRTSESKVVKKSESSNAMLILESPVATALDDKFIIRSYSPMETIAGGLVLETNVIAPWHKINGLLMNIPLDPDKRFRFLVEYNWKRPKSLKFWEMKFFNSIPKIKILKNDELELSSENLLFSKKKKENAKDEINNFFLNSYAKNPFRKVIALESVKNALLFSDNWLKIILGQMILDDDIIECQGGYALNKYKIELSDEDKNSFNFIEEVLRKHKNQPISLNYVIKTTRYNPKRVGDLMHVLIENGKAESLGDNLFMHIEHLEHLKKNIIEYFKDEDSLNISDFKKLTGLTRKTAIPLLEYLDRKKYTIRSGDVRIMGEKNEKRN